jgi:hypothetical protein
MSDTLLINRRTKRVVDTTYGDRDCLLFTYHRVSDEVYTLVGGGVKRADAEAWMNGIEVSPHTNRNPESRLRVGKISIEVVDESRTGALLCVGIGSEASRLTREDVTALRDLCAEALGG